jgi:hypothetical protein
LGEKKGSDNEKKKWRAAGGGIKKGRKKKRRREETGRDETRGTANRRRGLTYTSRRQRAEEPEMWSRESRRKRGAKSSAARNIRLRRGPVLVLATLYDVCTVQYRSELFGRKCRSC